MACHTGLQENILSSGARRVRRPGYSVPATPSASHSNFFWRLATLLLVVQQYRLPFHEKKRRKKSLYTTSLRSRTHAYARNLHVHGPYMPRHMHMGSFGAPASAAEFSCKTEAEVTVVSSSSSQHAPHYN